MKTREELAAELQMRRDTASAYANKIRAKYKKKYTIMEGPMQKKRDEWAKFAREKRERLNSQLTSPKVQERIDYLAELKKRTMA